VLTVEEDLDAHALRRQGWSISAIAWHLGRDRKTVRAVYCSMVCRQEAERVRDQALNEERDRRLAQTVPPALPARIGLPPPPPPGRASTRQQAPVRDPLEPTATRNCPHCQQPVTIVALLATPEAAGPTMPHHRTDVVPLRRNP
jgi:hypothetical protein